jgi:hypothetical protein
VEFSQGIEVINKLNNRQKKIKLKFNFNSYTLTLVRSLDPAHQLAS